jgi:hypothetical protein
VKKSHSAGIGQQPPCRLATAKHRRAQQLRFISAA